MLFLDALSYKVVIKSPQQFAEYTDSIVPKISIIFVDDDILQFDYYEECKEKAVYVYSTLKVHFVEHIMKDMKCQLKFYMTSSSSNTLNEKD